MSKKIILSLFILGLINVPALAKEPVQTIKLEENTIDFNLEDLTTEIRKNQEETNLEFDENTDPLPEIQKTVEEKTKEISNSINEKINEVSDAIENTQETVQQKVEEQIKKTQNILDSNPDEITDAIEATEETEKLIKTKETLEKEIEQQDNEIKEAQEFLQKQAEEKIEEIEDAKEELKEQAENQIEEIQKSKEALEEQINQQVEEVKNAKKVLKQQVEQQTEELKQIKDEKIEEVKSIQNEKPAVSETSQLRPLAPIIDLSSTKPKTEIEDDSTDAIKLTTPDNTQNKTTSTTVSIDAPKWEDFCETGYENASTKDRENLLNIINFVNAERIKSNYWAERREGFEKAITHCNSLEENSRSYCYENVRKSETEKNEMYEQQRKQVNYKNQGIKIDK